MKKWTQLESAWSKAKTGKRFDGGSFAVQCTWWEVLVWVLFALHRWLHLSQVTMPSRVFSEGMEGPGDRVTIQRASLDERRGRAVRRKL